MGFKFKHLIRYLSPSQGYLGHMQREKKRAAEDRSFQQREYNAQQNEIRGEQQRINQQLMQTRNQTNAGIARVARGRSRGGIFGDANAPGQAVGARLG
jgi:hypothetical protein